MSIDEIIQVVDDDDNPLRSAPRGEVYALGLRHRSVAVLCQDADDRVLVHRRTSTKRVYPGRYDAFVSGAVAAGESYTEAARREVGEELGVDTVPRPLFAFRYDGPDLPQWTAIFAVLLHPDTVRRLRPAEDEIAWHTFLTADELDQRMGEWPFCPDAEQLWTHHRIHGAGGRNPSVR